MEIKLNLTQEQIIELQTAISLRKIDMVERKWTKGYSPEIANHFIHLMADINRQISEQTKS
jgi:hypothetical protein